MQIVIDIPEENYEVILTKIMLACRGCKITELLKGHGRLVDADELIKQLETTANIEWNQQVGSSKGLEDAIDIVDNVPTIIQAYNCTKPQQGELENPFNDSRFGG